MWVWAVACISVFHLHQYAWSHLGCCFYMRPDRDQLILSNDGKLFKHKKREKYDDHHSRGSYYSNSSNLFLPLDKQMRGVSANQDSFLIHIPNFPATLLGKKIQNMTKMKNVSFSPSFLQVNVTSNRPVGMRGHTLNVWLLSCVFWSEQ